MRFRSIHRAFALSVVLLSPLARAQTGALTAAPDRLHPIEILANTGRGEEALRQLDALATSTPRSGRFCSGYAAWRCTTSTACRKRRRPLLPPMAADPHDDEAVQMRGLTLFRMGPPGRRHPHCWKARTAKACRQRPTPTYVLALCYVDTRRYDDARRAYALQYGLQPDSAAAYLLAGRMLLRREYLPVAERFAQEAITRNPKLPLAHELLGEIALAQNHLDVAQREFEQEVQENPAEPAPYDRLGDLYSRQGKYALARQALQRAVLLEPNATGPYILLGRTALREGDPVAALTFLQRANRMDPSSAMTHNLLAQAYRAMNRSEDAASELATVEKLHAAEEPKLNTLH